MKKISVLVCVFLLCFIPAFSQHPKTKVIVVKPPPPKPKKPTPPAKPDKGWELAFLVTIDGNGVANDFHEDDEFEWSIYHNFTGDIILNQPVPMSDPGWSQAEKTEALSSGRKTAWTQDLLSPAAPVYMVIGDKSTLLQKENDEGNTFENTSVTIRTRVDAIVMATSGTMAVFDKKSGTYNVTISLRCKTNTGGCTEKKSTTIAIKRSDHGYGDQPTTETTTKDTTTTFFEIQFPTTRDLIAGNKIHHAVDLKLPEMIRGHYEYDPEPVEPDKPIYKNVPESKTKVKIRVFYLLTKL
jgi:hypothetical protein